MKLPLPSLLRFLFSPPSAANSSRRHPRTLSPTTKTPAPLAGFLYLATQLLSPHPSFSPCNLTFLPAPLIHSTIQTPSSL
jgi:hypothetical protein